MKNHFLIYVLTLASVCPLLALAAHSENLTDGTTQPQAAQPWEDSLADYEQRLAGLEHQLLGWQSTVGCEAACGCECNCRRVGWFATADYLSWQVERNDLGYAILDPGATGVPNGGQPIRSLDLGLDSGFRVSLGHRTTQGWEVGFRYSNISSDDRQTFSPGGSQVLAVQSSPATGLTNANSVRASSEFEYDVFDLQAGHWFDASDSLSLMVLGGVRFTSIEHHLQVRYDGGAFINGLVDVPTDVDAFGLRMGGEGHWNVTPGFNLFGRTALSINTTDITASRRETNAGVTVINAAQESHPLVPALELALGVRYFTGDWSLAVGYELENWFNLVSPLEFSDNFNGGSLGSSQRDLGLHGLFVSAAYAY